MLNYANRSFDASAFHPANGNELIRGSIVVDGRVLRFQSPDLTMDVPLHRLKVRMGDGDDERICFYDIESPEWEIITFDLDLLDHPLIPQMVTIRGELDRAATKSEVIRRLRQIGYVAIGVMLFIWLVDFGTDVMVGALVARVPPKMEQDLGAEALEELQLEMPFVADTNRVALLTYLVSPLTNALAPGTNALTLYIAESEDPNAFALPGGHVVVTTGLLELVERPEELLGVVAHELAHVKQKHSIRSMISGAGPFLMFGVLLGGQGGLVGLLGGTTDAVVRSGFSQEYETEADDVGWNILVAARVDPRGMQDAFRKLQAHDAKLDLGDDMPQAFSTHPAVGKRIARLEKKWKKLKKQGDFRDLTPFDPALRAAAGK